MIDSKADDEQLREEQRVEASKMQARMLGYVTADWYGQPLQLENDPSGQGTYAMVTPDQRPRSIMVHGQRLEHCAETASGAWVYR